MNADGWADVESVFAEVLEAEPADRAALLDRRCDGRPELRAEVESLLSAHARAGGFITPVTLSPGQPLDGPAGPQTGDMVGAYRLAERVGEGGMGVVYRAERADDTYSQRVAIKLIAATVLMADGGRRFRAERQILAALQHPNIVTFLDGGFTAQGSAYLVMEYVEGLPITTFCRERRLPLDARLRLFRQVCSAVHHAHRHGVVHCDIKPGNVIVTPDEVPKVLDFGVARLLDGGPGRPLTTLPDMPFRAMTPNYASPEQLRGLPVTTSVDVYSLGVLLYEILTDSRPYDTTDLPFDEVLRRVVHTDPGRPSTARRADDSALPYEVRRALKGDLDAIVARSMDKVPERRYASAEELGDDVTRFLDGAPVQARVPSLPYVIGKLAARHRPAIAAAAAALVLLVTALVVTLWQARVATAERTRAERRFNEVRKLANTLIFTIHDAVAPLPGSTPVRQVIVTEALGYLERLAGEAHDDLRLRIELAEAYARIGRVQGHPQMANLGDQDGAIASFRKAQHLLTPTVLAPGAPFEAVVTYVSAVQALSQTLVVTGHRTEAVASAGEAVRVADALVDRMPADARARRLLASAYFGAASVSLVTESKPNWDKALTLYDALLAESPDDPVRQRNVALVEKYLGAYEETQHDYAAALQHHLRASGLDERRRQRNPNDRVAQFDVAIDLSNVAHAYSQTGNPSGGAEFYQRSLVIREGLAATDPKDVLARSKVAYVHRRLAEVYRDTGRRTLAFSHVRQALAMYEALGMSDVYHRLEMADSLWLLGSLEKADGRLQPACAAYAKALTGMRAVAAGERANRNDGTDTLPAVERDAAGCQLLASR
jgi:eukaryotic-like serine/threonine-protein kinase